MNGNDVGYAIRRRQGGSSYMNTLGSTTGTGTADEHYDKAKSSGSARIALGDGPIDTPHETMSPEQNAPAEMGSKSVAGERLGASYSITAKTSGLMDPTHGPTQAQGRTVPSVRGKSNANFQSGIQSAEQ